jgi:hypothetical protein
MRAATGSMNLRRIREELIDSVPWEVSTIKEGD